MVNEDCLDIACLPCPSVCLVCKAGLYIYTYLARVGILS